MRSKHFKAIVILCMAALLNACSSEEEAIEQKLGELLDKDQLTQKEFVMIIPRSGCSSCIGIADYFFKNTKDKEHIQFIFSRIPSVKTLKIKMGVDDLSKDNIYLDKANLYSSGVLNNVYPTVVIMKDKKVERFEYLNADNLQVLDLLRKNISANTN